MFAVRPFCSPHDGDAPAYSHNTTQYTQTHTNIDREKTPRKMLTRPACCFFFFTAGVSNDKIYMYMFSHAMSTRSSSGQLCEDDRHRIPPRMCVYVPVWCPLPAPTPTPAHNRWPSVRATSTFTQFGVCVCVCV